MKVLSVLNRKGGVGKTTCTLNIAFELERCGYNVLLIDLDAQTDLTNFFLEETKEKGKNYKKNIQHVLEGKISLSEAAVPVKGKNHLTIVPGSKSIDHTFQLKHSQKALYDSLQDEKLKDVDFVIIDFPPALNEAVKCGLYATHYTLLITETESLSIENLDECLKIIGEISKKSPNKLEALGILVNRVDMRRNNTKKNLVKLQRIYPDLLLEAKISVDSSLVMLHEKKLPLREFPYRSRCVSQFQSATGEMWERMMKGEE
jgi:chromosome partitioning protein